MFAKALLNNNYVCAMVLNSLSLSLPPSFSSSPSNFPTSDTVSVCEERSENEGLRSRKRSREDMDTQSVDLNFSVSFVSIAEDG